MAQLGAHSLAMALFFIDYNILYEMLCKCIDGKTYSMLPERFHSDVKIFGRGDLTIFVIDHAYITSQYKLGCGGRGCNCYIYSSTFMHALAH